MAQVRLVFVVQKYLKTYLLEYTNVPIVELKWIEIL